MTHIIRNAVDHGIELPAERLKAGKREIGILSVSARQSGNQILIDIHDDGRGIDGKRLVEKAVVNGVIEKSDAAQLTQREQLALIFEAGLSTAKEVTAISGRGVGMDVVRSNVGRIGGVVEVDSKLGEGTRMTLRVPLTLTIIPALSVSIGAQHFAIPRSAIEEIVRANGESVTLEHLGGAGVATIRGRRVPEVSLAEILGLESEVEMKDRTLIVLRPAGGDVYALSVDRIHDHEELVVKPAAPAVMATGLYAGTTLADDGSPILLFDPAGLPQVGGVKLETLERAARIAEGPAAAESKATAVLLFRGLDGGRRALRLAVVDRIEEVPMSAIKRAAGQLRVQVGDAILPLAGAELGAARSGQGPGVPPQRRLARDRLRVCRSRRLRRDRQRRDPRRASRRDQRRVAHQRRAGRAGRRALALRQPCRRRCAGHRTARCRMPGNDPWMQNMLRPIVEAAGYRVIGDEDEGDADLVIVSQGDEVAGERRKDDLAAQRTRGQKQERREHLPVRSGRAADGPEVGRAGRGK